MNMASHFAKATMQEIFRFQWTQARKALGLASTRQAHAGAMVAVRRFGCALNLNVHFHALVFDGVYVLDAFDNPVFMNLKPPDLDDLTIRPQRSAGRIGPHRRSQWRPQRGRAGGSSHTQPRVIKA